MAKFNDLYEFIDRAVKNRKYPSNTALGLKAALKLFENEANDDEKNSLDKFKQNLDQIYHSVSIKNKDVTAGSLATYKSRVNKVLREFEQYGIDPTKMNNWSVKTIVRQKRKEVSKTEKKSVEEKEESGIQFDLTKNFVFDFKGGIKLIIPQNQKTSDAVADGELKIVRWQPRVNQTLL